MDTACIAQTLLRELVHISGSHGTTPASAKNVPTDFSPSFSFFFSGSRQNFRGVFSPSSLLPTPQEGRKDRHTALLLLLPSEAAAAATAAAAAATAVATAAYQRGKNLCGRTAAAAATSSSSVGIVQPAVRGAIRRSALPPPSSLHFVVRTETHTRFHEKKRKKNMATGTKAKGGRRRC